MIGQRMTITSTISEQLRENQLSTGGFVSLIRQKNNSRKDVNACITALVLRELEKRQALIDPEVTDKAIQFLISCASSIVNGAYNFYPPDSIEGKINLPVNIELPDKIKVPDDADDTALITLLLLKRGMITRESVLRNTSVVLDKYRLLVTGNFDPPWFTAGAFYTWLEPGSNNMMDCCVNSNIVALYAYAGLQHLRGYKEACLLISNAVNWCGESVVRLASIIPFYAHRQELYYAVQHAVEMGAVELAPTLQKLEWANPLHDVPDADRPVCCSAYGNVTWHCPLLQQLRIIPIDAG
jgi:hypothetical protein